MASPQDSVSMALFCDFENVALGVRDAKFEKFDIKPVLERLLLKGSIVVKKAYCDWDRYKAFKASMHEASFELIEIPHVRQSGKNSADIRLVVDALDLCYTKSHVDTFVIISGDSDFSPLVSKLRENAKKVIGVGVKNSTSDLLVANCDEFIFYDDLVREQQRANAKREAREASVAAKRVADEDKQPKAEMESRKAKAIAIAVETFDALVSERGESGKIWASVLKSAIKRRKPDFSESYYGFRAFGNLLDEAQARGLLEVGRDDKSGAFVFRPSQTPGLEVPKQGAAQVVAEAGVLENGSAPEVGHKGRKKGKGVRKQGRDRAPAAAALAVETPEIVEAMPEVMAEAAPEFAPEPNIAPASALDEAVPMPAAPSEAAAEPAPKARRARKAPAKKSPANGARALQAEPQAGEPAAPSADQAKPAKAPRKSASRTSRARRAPTESNNGQ
ncbi:NYN domain-containing protein [Trinickia dabaoshanensis]|uniref:NYN domain-containing protein n=1 Tax=Trinickia dabaoshanensis TaxID=564714 RepID=A0A2N7VKI2_9BURK|nr:NYN domain-containing protein [Trinickia dabaoshanensis]PMS17684.1 NYN domain-containing protein [Trinickia dabaoshanensis]